MSKKYVELQARVYALEKGSSAVAGTVAGLIESTSDIRKKQSELEHTVQVIHGCRLDDHATFIENTAKRLDALELRLSKEAIDAVLEEVMSGIKEWALDNFQQKISPVAVSDLEPADAGTDTSEANDIAEHASECSTPIDLQKRSTQYDSSLEWINLSQLRAKYKDNCEELLDIKVLHKGDIAKNMVWHGFLEKKSWGYALADLGLKTGLMREIRVKNSTLLQFKNCAELDDLVRKLFSNPGLVKKYIREISEAEA